MSAGASARRGAVGCVLAACVAAAAAGSLLRADGGQARRQARGTTSTCSLTRRWTCTTSTRATICWASAATRITGIRGAAADLRAHMLYISHGGDGDGNGNGWLAKYDLLANRIVWDRAYDRGIDSFAVSRDGSGSTCRMESCRGRCVDRARRRHRRSPSTDSRRRRSTQHDRRLERTTGISRRPEFSSISDVASTTSDRVIRRIGPLRSGVRPFTINGRETLAYTTATGFLGFQVRSIASGRVLYTSTFGREIPYDPANFRPERAEPWHLAVARRAPSCG